MKHIKNSFTAKHLNAFTLCAIFLLSIIFPAIAHAETSDQEISEREILMLCLMSYKSEFKEDVSQMDGDVNFNTKWFGDYASPSELKGWKTVQYEVNSEESSKSGFCAATFKKGDNIVIAFKGADYARFFDNWKHLIPIQEHPRDKYAAKYINELKNAEYINENSKIYITGYSLGGHIAIYATGVLMSIDNLQDKFIKTVTFNPLGLGHVDVENEFIRYNLSKLPENKLVNYRICGDVVSTIADHFTKPITMKFIPIKRKFFPLLYWTNGPHISHHFFGQEPFLAK